MKRGDSHLDGVDRGGSTGFLVLCGLDMSAALGSLEHRGLRAGAPLSFEVES